MHVDLSKCPLGQRPDNALSHALPLLQSEPPTGAAGYTMSNLGMAEVLWQGS